MWCWCFFSSEVHKLMLLMVWNLKKDGLASSVEMLKPNFMKICQLFQKLLVEHTDMMMIMIMMMIPFFINRKNVLKYLWRQKRSMTGNQVDNSRLIEKFTIFIDYKLNEEQNSLEQHLESEQHLLRWDLPPRGHPLPQSHQERTRGYCCHCCYCCWGDGWPAAALCGGALEMLWTFPKN